LLERILYVSRASADTGLADVLAMARAADARNAASGLSGALVFVDGWFAQVLEGPAEAIRPAYAAILKDPRHEAVSFRARARALCPLFGPAGLVLRTATTLDPSLLDEFDYAPGFPVETFPADILLEFMVWASRTQYETLQDSLRLDRKRAVS
jgi:hypothetical protein